MYLKTDVRAFIDENFEPTSSSASNARAPAVVMKQSPATSISDDVAAAVSAAITAERERALAIGRATPPGLDAAYVIESIRTGMSIDDFRASLPEAMAKAILKAGATA